MYQIVENKYVIFRIFVSTIFSMGLAQAYKQISLMLTFSLDAINGIKYTPAPG